MPESSFGTGAMFPDAKISAVTWAAVAGLHDDKRLSRTDNLNRQVPFKSPRKITIYGATNKTAENCGGNTTYTRRSVLLSPKL